MRKFTQPERDFLFKIVSLKQSCSFDSLKFRNLLNNYIPYSFIRWPKQSFDSNKITFYSSKQENIVIDKCFNDVVDFIFFIEELEKLSLIKLVSDGSRFSSYTVLYDTTIFSKVDMSDELVYVNNGKVDYDDFNKGEYKLEGISESLTRLTDSLIYPLPLLEDLIDNSFEDINYKQYKEEKEFNAATLSLTRESLDLTRKSQNKTNVSIIISAIGCVAACAAAFISYRFSERTIKIDDTQFQIIRSQFSDNNRVDTVCLESTKNVENIFNKASQVVDSITTKSTLK